MRLVTTCDKNIALIRVLSHNAGDNFLVALNCVIWALEPAHFQILLLHFKWYFRINSTTTVTSWKRLGSFSWSFSSPGSNIYSWPTVYYMAAIFLSLLKCCHWRLPHIFLVEELGGAWNGSLPVEGNVTETTRSEQGSWTGGERIQMCSVLHYFGLKPLTNISFRRQGAT